MNRISSLGAALIALSLATGCATQVPTQSIASAPAQGQRAEYGQVQSIDVVRGESQTSGGGALLGGLIGAVVGRQIGHGSDRAAGTLVGAAGGAIIGNQIEKGQRGAQDVYRVTIRTEHGLVRTFDYQQLADLRVGDRVRIENNQVFRL